MYFEEHEGEGGPTTLFLHGGGVGGWSWGEQLPAFSTSHLLVPDLPEHGNSVGPFSIDGAAEAVARLIRARAKNGRARVVGLSLGAQVATRLLALAPELVERAFLSGTLVRPTPFLASALGRTLMRWTVACYLPFRNRSPLVRANMRALGIPAAYEEPFKADTQALTLDGFCRVMTENLTFRMPPDLSRATAPVLVVVGERERKTMRASARQLVAALPNARGVVVERVGHNWNLEAPARFNALVQAFFDDAPLPEGTSGV